jgi:hypothetical protein
MGMLTIGKHQTFEFQGRSTYHYTYAVAHIFTYSSVLAFHIIFCISGAING